MNDFAYEQAVLACNRLNTRDITLIFNRTENLSDIQYAYFEKYEEFNGFEIIDSGSDVEGRQTIIMLYTADGSDTEVIIEKDLDGVWKVLHVY